MLKRHLMTDHSMTPERYRERWGLGRDYPMVAPDYRVRSVRALAKKIGLGRKPGARVSAAKAPAKASAKMKSPERTRQEARPPAQDRRLTRCVGSNERS